MTLGNLLNPSEVHLPFELGLKDEICRMPFKGFGKRSMRGWQAGPSIVGAQKPESSWN